MFKDNGASLKQPVEKVPRLGVGVSRPRSSCLGRGASNPESQSQILAFISQAVQSDTLNQFSGINRLSPCLLYNVV